METTLRLAIIRAGLPEPEVNWAILDVGGTFQGFADLAFPRFRVLVEYDGDHHRTDPDQYFTDVDRLWMFQTLGWRIVRVNKTHPIAEAIRRIRTALRE
jgi:very-short-patch-repair endonuclease